MARFEVVPTALSAESRRLAQHSPTVAQLAGSLHAAGGNAAEAAGHPAAYDALAALGGRLAGTLSQLEASIAGLASATDAAARRYENTDEGQFR